MAELTLPLAPADTATWRSRIDALSLPLILGYTLLTLAWLLPAHYLPWMMFQQEAVAAAAGLLLCWAAVEKSSQVVWPLPAMVAAAMCVVPWLQFGAHQILFLTDALLASAYLLGLALAIVAAASLSSGPRRAQVLDGLTGSCVVAAIFSAGIALYQWLNLPHLSWIVAMEAGGRAFANFSQPNHLSTLLALGVAGILRWYENRRIGPWVAALGVAWLGWGIVMTGSRTGWIFVAMLALGTVGLRHRARLRTAPWVVGVGVALFAALVVLDGALQAQWLQLPSAAGVRTAVGVRTLLWQGFVDAAMRAPWFGYGWNQVPLAQWAGAASFRTSGGALMQSHSLLLDLMLYNGVVLGGLLFAALAWWTIRVVRGCRDGDNWFLALALLALLAHAQVEYPLHYLYFLLPAGLLMGALDRLAVLPAGRPARMFGRATLWVPALLMAGLLIWVGTEYMRAEEALRRLRFAAARISITMDEVHSPEVQLLDGWKGYVDATKLQVRDNMPPAEMALLRDVALRFPYPAAIYRYAHALALNNEGAAARRVLNHLCMVYPKPVQVVMHEAWDGLRAKDKRLQPIEFPTCAD